MENKISVLYVRKKSIYKSLVNDCYDEERDARNFDKKNSVIAHPPCRAWSKLSALSKATDEEKSLAPLAVELIRKVGGVLEHPASSALWKEKKLELPMPGAGYDKYGGWSLSLDQFWFGHKAKKSTWLYIVGCKAMEIPEYPLCFDAIQYVVTSTARNKKQPKKTLSKKDREATPVLFAKWLIELALICNKNINQ